MDTTSLVHCLTDRERLAFEDSGYLLIRGALTPDQAEHFAELARPLDQQRRQSRGVGNEARANMFNVIGREARFLDLVDWPTTLPKVWGILGWNIQLYHTQLIVTPPGSRPIGNWHQDDYLDRDLETELQPRISLKVAYFLSDQTNTGMGNLLVVPGSHTTRSLTFAEQDHRPVGAMAVTARAGDALVFDRRLWHAASPNDSDVTRIVLFYGYSYRWLRPRFDMKIAHLLDQETDPIRRQLMGACVTTGGYFRPKDEDVPLRTWLRQNVDERVLVASPIGPRRPPAPESNRAIGLPRFSERVRRLADSARRRVGALANRRGQV